LFTAEPRKVARNAAPFVNSGSAGTNVAWSFHQPLPAAFTRLGVRGLSPRCWARNSLPRKYPSEPTIIASTDSPFEVVMTMWRVEGRTSCRSTVQTDPAAAYRPMISKLLAELNMVSAPSSRACVAGRPKGLHADTIIRTEIPVKVNANPRTTE